mmetsp:Transcript_21942/g.54270  ORF Transcript_21942/g.54270 Transcript_21942/m.54270 type:complete len:201 (+) Transcript_21942:1985-2587(+)
MVAVAGCGRGRRRAARGKKAWAHASKSSSRRSLASWTCAPPTSSAVSNPTPNWSRRLSTMPWCYSNCVAAVFLKWCASVGRDTPRATCWTNSRSALASCSRRPHRSPMAATLRSSARPSCVTSKFETTRTNLASQRCFCAQGRSDSWKTCAPGGWARCFSSSACSVGQLRGSCTVGSAPPSFTRKRVRAPRCVACGTCTR